MSDNKKEEYDVEGDIRYIRTTTTLNVLSEVARAVGLELAEVEFESIEQGGIKFKRCLFKQYR